MWYLKIDKDRQIRTQTHSLTSMHCDSGKGHTNAQRHSGSLLCKFMTVMPFIIQPVLLFPILKGSDLLVKPRWLWGSICFVSARYAFTTTTRDILSPCIYVSWLKTAPHKETASVICLLRCIWMNLSVSISEATHKVRCGRPLDLKSGKIFSRFIRQHRLVFPSLHWKTKLYCALFPKGSRQPCANTSATVDLELLTVFISECATLSLSPLRYELWDTDIVLDWPVFSFKLNTSSQSQPLPCSPHEQCLTPNGAKQ